ncbi:unnamed protein product [Dovyalis caffra]|uniref:Uncharacterized protein n=1 Tax=Dovyalis caffra TaxID=77055 RepID=A0AAV1QNQ6_9ROSI|nr:unnamed protein product [Dovyalis caffra]
MKVVSASKVSKRFLLLVAIVGLMVTSAVAKGGRGGGVILGSSGAGGGSRYIGRGRTTGVKTSASVAWGPTTTFGLIERLLFMAFIVLVV